jgi:hexosaminidase
VSSDLVLDHDVTLSNNTIVMFVLVHTYLMLMFTEPIFRVWRSPSRATYVASKNFRIIHAPSDYFYLVRPLASR